MNRVVLLGRIANDLDLRKTSNNEDYMWFTLAINETYNSKTTTQFVPCVAFGKTASLINQYFSKGSLLLVEGSINVRKVASSNGTPQTSVTVNVNKIHFVGNKKNDSINKTSSLSDYSNDILSQNENQNEELEVDDGIFWED